LALPNAQAALEFAGSAVGPAGTRHSQTAALLIVGKFFAQAGFKACRVARAASYDILGCDKGD